MITSPKTKRGKKKFLVVVSQKGGCGKSFTARALAQLMRGTGLTVAVFDGDEGVGTTFKALATRDENHKILTVQDPLVGAASYSMREAGQRDLLINSLSYGAPIVIHDMPGGSVLDLEAVMDDGRAARFSTIKAQVADHNYELTFLHLVTPDTSTMLSVGLYAEALGQDVNHIAVLNMAFGNEDDFAIWPDSKSRKKLVAAGGKEIWLPKLDPTLLKHLDETRLSMGCALPHPELTIIQGGRLRKFRTDLLEELRTVTGWEV